MEENKVTIYRTTEREIKATFHFPKMDSVKNFEEYQDVEMDVRNVEVFRSANLNNDIITIEMYNSKEVVDKISQRVDYIDEYYDIHEDFFKNVGVLKINDCVFQKDGILSERTLIKYSFEIFNNCEPTLVGDCSGGKNSIKIVFVSRTK